MLHIPREIEWTVVRSDRRAAAAAVAAASDIVFTDIWLDTVPRAKLRSGRISSHCERVAFLVALFSGENIFPAKTISAS